MKQPTDKPEKIKADETDLRGLEKLVITTEDVALGRADQKLADFTKMVLKKYSV